MFCTWKLVILGDFSWTINHFWRQKLSEPCIEREFDCFFNSKTWTYHKSHTSRFQSNVLHVSSWRGVSCTFHKREQNDGISQQVRNIPKWDQKNGFIQHLEFSYHVCYTNTQFLLISIISSSITSLKQYIILWWKVFGS